MALRINPGYKSLNLYFDQPTNAYDVDDVDTGGTTQVTQTDIRTDLQGLRIWVRSTSWAGADPTNSELYYDGPFQGYIAIDKLTQASTDLLADNTTYYIKYAFISKLDFFSKLDIAEHTILPLASGNPSEATGTTLDVTSPIVGYLTRDPIEIPTDSDGSNPVYTGATGTFKVYRYGQDISTNAAVTYAVSTATGGVTAAFGTGANKNVYSVTAITDLTGTIKLTATYTDPQNNANTITIEQILNVSKRRPGQTAPLVVLTATGQVFVLTEDSSGSAKNPSSIKLIATASNVTNPTYTWVLDPDGTNTPIVGTGAGYTGGYLTGTSLNTNKDELTINSSIFTGATPQFKLFSVTVGSSVVGSTISVQDRMSVYYLKEGSDSLVISLVNENQTVTLDKTGTTISGLPIESEAVVLEGTTQITAPIVTFAVNSQSGFGGTLTINTAVNNPVAGKPAGYIRATQVTANQANATITATVAGTTLSKVLTVNRVQDGADGTNIDAQLTNDFHAIPTAADGTGGVYTGASTTIEVYKNGVLQTSGFTFYVSDLQNVKYRGTGDTSDRTGTGVTNGALTATSGTATVNIVELSADSGYVDITAKQTSDGQLFTERFSLSRNKAGVIGNDAVIYEIRSNVNAITKASPDAGTDGAHTPSSINFKIYQTVGNNLPALTGGARLYYIQWNSPATEPTANDTNAVLVPVTGLIPAVTIANNSDYTSVNIKLLYKNAPNNYTELDREEIGVVFKGDKGDSGTSVDIVFARGSSPPSLTATGNPPNSSWSTSVSTAPGTGLLWSSTGYSSDGGTTWSWDTAVQVEGATGGSGESVAEISAFTRTTSNLSSSTISGGSYNFSNKTLTVPTGGSVTWYAAIPAGTDPLWETRTTAAVTAPTTVDNTLSWSTPVKVAQDGYTPVKNIDYFDGASAITANLTNESHSIPVDRSGAPTSYIGAETEVSVEQAGSNITSSYTWTITASSNLDTTLQAHTSNQLNSSTQLRFAFTNSNTKATLQLMGPTVTSILVRFTGTRTNYPNIVKDFTMVSVKPDVSVLELSNDVHEFSATNAGLVSVFTGGSTSYSVKRNGVDESSSWTFTAQATAGITFSYSDTSGTAQSQNTTTAVNIYAAGTTTNRTISVTNLTTAFRTGSITVTASRTGYSNLVQTFSLSSILAGYTPVKNTDYFDGNNAKYWTIDKTASVLYKNAPDSATSGTYTSTVITGKYYDGNTGSTSGYLSIRDNDTGTYTSASNPYTLSPGAGTGLTSVGIALYSDSSRTTLVATAVIPIVFRGAAGQDSTVPGATGAQIYKVYKAHTSNSTAPAGIAVDGTTTTTNGATPSGWSTTPPTLDATNFVQWESDGKQPSGSTATTWSAPYLSYFKVNSLDAITATIGTFQSAPNGQQRTVISGSKILVYDSSNNIRVKIGDLT